MFRLPITDFLGENATVKAYLFRLRRTKGISRIITTMHCFSSNCVVNLSPDKPTVIREAQRVLKVSYNSIVHPHLLWGGRGLEL